MIELVDQRRLRVDVHHEDGCHWAEVRELPGCFVSGRSAAEVIESAEEAVVLYLTGKGALEGLVGVELVGFDLRIETDNSVKPSEDVSTTER
jgi:predicted RNase H-like HicB family nuclease